MPWVDLVIIAACAGAIIAGGVLCWAHAWTALQAKTWYVGRVHAAYAALYAAPVAACIRILWTVWP